MAATAVTLASVRAIPGRDLVLVSRLAPDEVVEALDALVAERTLAMPWGKIDKPFQGTLRGRRFEIARVSRLWRAGAIPVIEGTIVPREGGSSIRLRFRPAWTPVATALWIAALSIPSVLALHGMWKVGVPDPFLLLVVGVSAAAWWAASHRFGREVGIALQLLAPIGVPETDARAAGSRPLARE